MFWHWGSSHTPVETFNPGHEVDPARACRPRANPAQKPHLTYMAALASYPAASVTLEDSWIILQK